ncbi:serine/threonine-protein kinase [Sphaerisporangium fuscum]|uniref:serine/threonine-protein kinase n=1 Tax=Sphaerisporangium fuscum TaxID=2835868 RepID=UPI001BDC938B|nr:serine/threonine-protein kinase [Sphaerisporangium fuscum]
MTGETMPETLDRLGPYKLLRRLGEGGMGVVHLGLDQEYRQVAVKVLHPHVAADLKARDRLTREVETMRRVRSPRVAEVVDAELTGATPYIVTRYAPGRTLEETVLSDGPLPEGEVIRLARGLSEALVAIHAADVIHRDLKPANVMLVNGEPLVIDFGIAHLVNATRLTQTGMFVGTPGYLAPEIIRDEEITQAADVHALAATVFFGATGKPPFGTGSFESVCFAIMEGRANIDQAPVWMRGWLRAAFSVDAASRPDAVRLLSMAKQLDPSVTALRETAIGDGRTRRLDSPGTTHVIGGGAPDATHVLNGGAPDATHVLNGGAPDATHVLNGGAPDSTHVIEGDPARTDDLPPTKRTKPASEDSYSDLLPPVRYAEPERRVRGRAEAPPPAHTGLTPDRYASPPAHTGLTPDRYASPPAHTGFAPDGYAAPPPAGHQPAAYAPPRTETPPPYPDQRVAGPPPPPYAQPTRGGAAAPATQGRPYAPEPARGPEEPERPRYRAGHPVLAAALLVVAVAAARMLPVLTSVFILVAVLCLRVGEYLFGDLAERRQLRGSSASDPLLAVLGTPWALIRAVLATLVATPVAVMFALCAWGALHWLGGMTTDTAAAFAASAFVGGLFLLPGGKKPRRAVARTLTAVIRSPGAGMVATIIVGTLAFFAVVAAWSAVASWIPWHPPSQAIDSLGHQARSSATGLIGGLVKDLMSNLGLGFLAFWSR